MSPPEPAVTVFEAHRPRLTRLAYRMLGSMSEAEDVVQDAWLRWRSVDMASVQNPGAFLSRTVTRLCLDQMKSARARRETYVGAWLPEPLIAVEPEEPMEDELTLTLMMALERLSPLERAAFLLHDVFGVGLDEVAGTLDREPAAVRQLAVRARRHVQDARSRYPVAQEEGARIAQAFFNATRSGDLNMLQGLLAEGVVIRSDGGGKVLAFINPIFGLQKAIRLYRGLFRKQILQDAQMVRPMWIDGLPGYVSRERGGVLQTTAFEIEDGRIVAIYITRNPDKLERVTAALSAAPGEAGAH
ncbi:sigma-70 family RNA polymerase sigma factor [Caulobacter segnis]|uniref:sigma-70 family RNA polymerase sigma factor n=1 Tax=Caulobacter segnis TaxID=88688 RepID=UPI00240FF72F|nr:sigma-70 family RNA polymerase sigma factor [Caulobacter segnis]MDG2520855.1 sigma-70 family RNA polymerase sigma factor [Caulobacter segnis]